MTDDFTNEELIRVYHSTKDEKTKRAVKNKLMKRNEKFLYSACFAYLSSVMTRHEAMTTAKEFLSEASIGLSIAVDRYNPEIGNKLKFTTYAVWWIRERISKQFRIDKMGLVLPPFNYSTLKKQGRWESPRYVGEIAKTGHHYIDLLASEGKIFEDEEEKEPSLEHPLEKYIISFAKFVKKTCVDRKDRNSIRKVPSTVISIIKNYGLTDDRELGRMYGVSHETIRKLRKDFFSYVRGKGVDRYDIAC